MEQVADHSWRTEGVFNRIKEACYAGLSLEDLQHTILEQLRKEINYEAYCINRVDPTTELMIGSIGEGVGGTEEVRTFLEQIYFEDYLLDFRQLSRTRRPAQLVSKVTNGRLEKALRYRILFNDLRLGDELRAVFTAGHRPWGSVSLFRGEGGPFFAENDLQLMVRLAPHIGAGMRAAVLRSMEQGPSAGNSMPGMLLLREDGRLEFYTPAAERWLLEIEDYPGQWELRQGLPVAVITLTAALKRALSMQTEAEQELLPQVTVRGRSGSWLTLHASTVAGAGAASGHTTVLIGPAVPGDLARIQTSAYGLTPQEDAICRFVVQGATTQEIAGALYITQYTVQDHLKHIFEKVGVRSRRELVKQLYLQSEFYDLTGR